EGFFPVGPKSFKLQVEFGGPEIDAAVGFEIARRGYFNLRQCTYVSCWHLSTVESAAMWKQYVAHGEGIAVCTTVNRLHDALKHSEKTINVQSVQYVENHTWELPASIYSHLLRKLTSFEHESEVRA